MSESPIKIRDLILVSFFSLAVIVGLFFSFYFDNRTKIVFCDVGQGDATYIRVRNTIDILIDAGPDQRVLSCLGKYMPFYDKTIEYAFLSHPQIDHFGGFTQVLSHYHIASFYTSPVTSNKKSFIELFSQLKQNKVKIHTVEADDQLKIDKDIIHIVWPKKELVGSNSTDEEMNDYSLMFSFRENDLIAFFSGDASPYALNNLSKQSIPNVSVLKIPHHGSKNGLTRKFLQLADPSVSVISVGKNNSYGHPAKEILDMLKATKTKILRTDTEGDIVFKITNDKNQITNQ